MMELVVFRLLIVLFLWAVGLANTNAQRGLAQQIHGILNALLLILLVLRITLLLATMGLVPQMPTSVLIHLSAPPVVPFVLLD